MGELIGFPSYIYEKEKRLEKKANELFELEQELSYKSFEMELEESRLNLKMTGQKSRMIVSFVAGFVVGTMTFTAAIFFYGM